MLLNTVPLGKPRAPATALPTSRFCARICRTRFSPARVILALRFRYNCPVTEAKSVKGGLDITAGGRPYTVGALIGADGINSAVRKLASQQSRALLRPVRGVARHHSDRLVPARPRSNVVLWMASGGHFVHYPVSGGSALNCVLVLDDDYKTAAMRPKAISAPICLSG